MSRKDRKLLVTAVPVKRVTGDSAEKAMSFGEEGGDTLRITELVNTTPKGLLRAAMEEYQKWAYDGYRGSFTTWINKFVRPKDVVEIIDPRYPERSYADPVGRKKPFQFLVEAVTYTLSQGGGGRQEIHLARRITESDL